MKVKIITVATYDGLGLAMLKKSLDELKFDYVVLEQGKKWKGFGTKIIATKEYLTWLSGYSHFIFVDAYDIYFLNNLEHINNIYLKNWYGSIVFGTEKACWPVPTLEDRYPANKSQWKYLNSGAYMAPIDQYLKLVSRYEVQYKIDDQLYFTEAFLGGQPIQLDYNCELFQSIAFEHENDFSYNGTLVNNFTGTKPSIIHGNGRTDMSKIYKLGRDNIFSVTNDELKKGI